MAFKRLLYYLDMLLIVGAIANWAYCSSTTHFGKIEIPNQLSDTIADMAYVDSRVMMSGLILFGPKMDRSILRSVRRRLVDDSQCLNSTLKLFKKHCGLRKEQRLKHMRAFANICNYVADKRAIEEAFILVCGMNNVEPYGIDVRNPTIDVTPAPVRGSSYLCGRASVNAISRMKIGNYAKSHRLLFVPSFFIPGDWRNKMVQVCLHGNASLGLCQCKKADWISVVAKLWSPAMSPFEQRFLDVKFIGVDSGFLTVTLDEESEVWRYVLLVIGNALIYIAPVVRKFSFSRDVDSRPFILLVLANTSILLSSTDMILALVAIGICHAVHYLICCIKLRMREHSRRATYDDFWDKSTSMHIVDGVNHMKQLQLNGDGEKSCSAEELVKELGQLQLSKSNVGGV